MTVRRRIMAWFCGCDEIDCNRCTVPWVPPEKRSKAELIEDLAESDEIRNRLRDELRKKQMEIDCAIEVLSGMATIERKSEEPR